jgi:hypothetical protein
MRGCSTTRCGAAACHSGDSHARSPLAHRARVHRHPLRRRLDRDRARAPRRRRAPARTRRHQSVRSDALGGRTPRERRRILRAPRGGRRRERDGPLAARVALSATCAHDGRRLVLRPRGAPRAPLAGAAHGAQRTDLRGPRVGTDGAPRLHGGARRRSPSRARSSWSSATTTQRTSTSPPFASTASSSLWPRDWRAGASSPAAPMRRVACCKVR